METIQLKVKPRLANEKDSTKRLIPAILYGRGIENKSLWVDYQTFLKVHEKAGESTILSLEVEGNKAPLNVLIYDVQYDPVRDTYRHIDFYQVRMDEEITAEVELVFVGESPAVKANGGVFVKSIDAIDVTCLPKDLPGELTVDISSIKTFDDYIYVKDLKLPANVTVDLDPETVVALVSPPRSQEELEQLDEKVEVDMDKVEGMKKEEPVEGNSNGEKKEAK